ncbi:NADPH-dependent glutamate synthase beta subunit-like oxidoreductase/ferredoxin [Clostridium saccharoperbutylacetonicum]|uniref:Ferredoxin n=1 Tax=Clostridium saccharoperbutylacetonicum N1-4(HMT) TaxID=931276 RepID=M1MN20_9CLOT|nr:FAD-dependent oxidoreductase [Clostridium saccharoperbutylacetonicum]AGF57613.1 ferredoxin [Clostridium saccharoperbutylacetonicum N1-4(HMT)]NRT61619.1 NADPH-dependent glutamate synthase beta subunit-like oxidoreductase/ferredoxin [Clostridium saccharoperbutylacetonicum]NSB24942.1 NADPH-dependent glutamate synthase beta subunit-like oxidoreductase/ferredoxin [Clostridium saccharoperbutylacetonicum]NSB44313.1 NADPH-dependent glutamate synthase beta subunit-like oxidoreductase/ferredoxin [Clos
MKIIIEGKEIEAKEGASVLEASLEAGIYIPHLCKHPDLEAVGGCRLCSVEVDGVENPVPACKTTVQDGMSIKISTEKSDKTRKMAMELILATHPAECTGCPKYGKCELQSLYQYMGVSAERWRKKSRPVPNDSSNPLIDHLFTRCIRCGRCIRACRELRGVRVLDYQRTKDGIRVGVDGGLSLEEAGCKFCGACIEVCPTGSIMDSLGMKKEDMSYSDSVVPCRAACPAHTDVPRYIRYIKEGDFVKATAVIREKVPFPETLGNICNHVCEDNCKRNEFENPISVCKLKKAAAEGDDGSWKSKVRREAATGKKVAVIGAGPAGLTAAYFLAKKGHSVTIFEENEKAGGQCRYGIPAYRLPDDVLDREIGDILAEGIELLTNNKVENPKELLNKGYDSVLVSVGTHKGTLLPLEGNDLQGVYVNAEFLKKARQGQPLEVKEKIMILGGGNVAYDCARTALRLGAKEVHIACLENIDQITATKEEIEEGREEGIILHVAHSFLRIAGSEKVEGVELQKVDKFYFDSDRKAVIELVEGSNEIIPVDNVIFAVGQKPAGTEAMEIELTHGPYIKTNESSETSVRGIFAAGDVVTGTKSVISAIAAGRKSAEEIDKYLGGNGDISENLLEKETPDPYIGSCSGFSKIERTSIELVEADKRKCNFDIVEKTLSKEKAMCEASRCLQCDLRLNLKAPKMWNEY